MNPNTLQNTWMLRQSEIRAERNQLQMETAANELFQELVNNQLAGDRIREEMDRVCRTANSVRDLRFAIWSYRTRTFDRSMEEDRLAYGEGYDEWRLQRDDYVSRQGWNQTVNQIPIWKVIGQTDILSRLTVALFGTTNFMMYVQHTSTMPAEHLGIKVKTYHVFLSFYPNGLPMAHRSLLHKVARKYQPAPETPPATPHLTSTPPTLPVPPPIRRQSARYVYDDITGISRELLDELEYTLNPEEDYRPEARCFCQTCVAE